jgi:hypothetical protein
MRPNVSAVDRTVRIIAGLVLCSAFFLLEEPIRWVGVVGLVPLVTGFVGWCPAYRLLGLSSCAVGAGKGALSAR